MYYSKNLYNLVSAASSGGTGNRNKRHAAFAYNGKPCRSKKLRHGLMIIPLEIRANR